MGVKITAADTWTSKVVRQAADYTCEHCGVKGPRMENCHIFGRRAAVTRYDLLNCICMCHHCHRTFTENPIDFRNWVESRWPGRIDILQEKRQGILKNNAQTRKDVARHYRLQYDLILKYPEKSPVSWI